MQQRGSSVLQNISSDILTLETTICHVIKGDEILLKQATRGISKGKWNAPGGRIDAGESPEACAIREVFEETGLKVSDLFLHGELWFYKGVQKEVNVHSYLFSTKKFSGKLQSSEEGEVKWSKLSDVDFDQLWQDDIVWWQLMLNGKKFDGEFYFDDHNKTLLRCGINLKD